MKKDIDWKGFEENVETYLKKHRGIGAEFLKQLFDDYSTKGHKNKTVTLVNIGTSIGNITNVAFNKPFDEIHYLDVMKAAMNKFANKEFNLTGWCIAPKNDKIMTSLKEEHDNGSLDLQKKLNDIADKKEEKQLIDCDNCKKNETPECTRKCQERFGYPNFEPKNQQQ